MLNLFKLSLIKVSYNWIKLNYGLNQESWLNLKIPQKKLPKKLTKWSYRDN